MKPLPLRHFLLALAVVAVWGSNFTVAKLALHDLPPVFFAFLRFLLVFFPAALFIRRPAVPWRLLAAYGVLIGAVQFGFLFMAMKHDISPGLASLVVQSQAFFTIGLAMMLSGEQVKPFQWLALLLAASGLAVIMVHGGADATPVGVILVLVAALGWAGGNQVSRLSDEVNMLAYVVWSSVFALPPLLALALFVDGWPAIRSGLTHAGAVAWASLAYQAVANSMFGYAVWGWLLARYPAATVAPLSLLVPVFGFTVSALVMGENFPMWKLAAFALVLGGLAFNLLWPRFAATTARR
ncbi:MAG: EamA family transporter [Alphaproteobacteria bacterium]|nr:EamA family transporter [Alphaproteobacteria bacterium]